MNNHSLEPIGWVCSPFKEKFGAPRQPREVSLAEGQIHFHEGFNPPEAFRSLEGFSHLWLIFRFHHCDSKPWNPTVRPPRLGGNTRVGVYASRSPFRPNSLGLSAVANGGTFQHPTHGLSLNVGGIDLIDQTPVYDIKPYLPHSDSLPDASLGYSPASIPLTEVRWEVAYDGADKDFISQTLRLDPTPAYQTQTKTYGILLGDKNVIFKKFPDRIVVINVTSTGLQTDSH